MPHDALRLDIPAPLADDLRAASDACGMPVDDFVRQVLMRETSRAQSLDGSYPDEFDMRRLAESGEDVEAKSAFADFRKSIEDARRSKP